MAGLQAPQHWFRGLLSQHVKKSSKMSRVRHSGADYLMSVHPKIKERQKHTKVSFMYFHLSGCCLPTLVQYFNKRKSGQCLNPCIYTEFMHDCLQRMLVHYLCVSTRSQTHVTWLIQDQIHIAEINQRGKFKVTCHQFVSRQHISHWSNSVFFIEWGLDIYMLELALALLQM